jgi:hypothetical protein
MSDVYDGYLEDPLVAAPRRVIEAVAEKDPRFKARCLGIPEDLIEGGLNMDPDPEPEESDAPAQEPHEEPAPKEEPTGAVAMERQDRTWREKHPSRCKGKNKRGRRCKMFSLADSDFCYAHDSRPEYAERRKATTRKGARKSNMIQHGKPMAEAPPPPTDLESLRDYQSWLIDALARGEIDKEVAKTLKDLINSFAVVVEKLDMAAEIASLRRQLAEAKKR